jgi:hypothetical protein
LAYTWGEIGEIIDATISCPPFDDRGEIGRIIIFPISCPPSDELIFLFII